MFAIWANEDFTVKVGVRAISRIFPLLYLIWTLKCFNNISDYEHK